ncbi:MAG: hypothetical protein D3924_20735 [Candidatus Electrothrix sp. AR4]|nr:hypothetical protein [Candidatus Electrothrix sp. AR4]
MKNTIVTLLSVASYLYLWQLLPIPLSNPKTHPDNAQKSKEIKGVKIKGVRLDCFFQANQLKWK